MRVLELFAGIGGLAAAWPEAAIVAAIDISQPARTIYEHNFPHVYLTREIESLALGELAELQCDCWWLSPPCQPYTRKGQRRDLADSRAKGFQRILSAIDELRPPRVALENVAGFSDSRGMERLTAVLEKHGYNYAWRELCPTEMGWPNYRARCYLLASHEPLIPWQPLPTFEVNLGEVVRSTCGNASLIVPEEIFDRYGQAMHRVDVHDAGAVTACFCSGYGKSILKAGSYLQEQGRIRRFSPSEILDILGFPPSFELPGIACSPSEPKNPCDSIRFATSDRELKVQWKLVGNSLSLPAVRYVLRHLPGGPALNLPWTEKYLVGPTRFEPEKIA